MKRLERTKIVNGRAYHNFKCTCGRIVERRSDTSATSCGCLQKSKLLKNKDLPADTPFTLLEPVVDQKTKVLVRCVCGHIFKAQPTVIFRPETKSCSKCKNISKEYESIGGVRNHPAYTILDGMKQRCYNENSDVYKYYGGAGITICDDWLNSYVTFCQWADNNGFKPGLTIDRINVDLGYTPNNCRWVPKIDQRENKHMQHNNTSGFVGVSFLKTLGKFESYYNYNGKKHNFGYYNTALEASQAREQALKENKIKYNRQGKLNGEFYTEQS